MRILLTTTSYQDTPGEHHALLESSTFEVVHARGPLTEDQLLGYLKDGQGFDGLLNGDDAITARFIDAALDCQRPLKVIAKYGIGLDSIDVAHATEKQIPVLFTPGVNHTTVAEHAIGLMIALVKDFPSHIASTRAGKWQRKTGHELAGKMLGVLGMGRIGKELIKRCRAFDMPAIAYDMYFDEDFATQYDVQRAESVNEVLMKAQVISLHLNLSDETRRMINDDAITKMREDAILINTARGGLIDEQAVAEACRNGRLAGYAADVLEIEPIVSPHPFEDVQNIIITPHIGSRTYESVERQAMRATKNLINYLNGDEDFIQANTF